MDYFSHGLWSYIFFHRIKKPIYAVLFGLLPDTFSWGIYFFYRIFTGMEFGKPNLELTPDWVFTLYGVSHSLVVSLFVIGIVYLILKKVPIFMWAWPIAIVMDVITHTREFLPTPFLWPLSDWVFPGISWGTKWFMVTNLSLIIMALIWIKYRKKEKRKKKN